MPQPKFSEIEQQILKFWEEQSVFEKSLKRPSPKGDFVFYDGPPFATGLPHYGHILASTIKDVIPRYKTMRGYRVRRRWGWDCHGLPIENIVEQQLGISGKKQIEEKGVAVFNAACREGVLKYAAEWGKLVRRIGRWVEFDTSYKTMDSTYMESVWWALRQVWDKKLIYEGRKVLLYCPRCETPISNFEVAMDNSYKEVTEEAVTIKFPISNFQFPNTFLLAWTTTPWTLPGNVALAVGEEIEYVVVKEQGARSKEQLILAKARFAALGGEYEVVREIKGKDLVGLEYKPLFNIPALKSKKTFKVYPGDFVTTEEGTGIVHTAVVYGEDDYNLGLKYKLPVVPLLDEKGVFNEQAPELIRGQYFKNSEKIITDDLDRRGLLLKREINTHSYPYCWRCETPLFYNAIPAWFINIQKIKKKLLKANEKINWAPPHLKHGRFQKGIEGAPDWNISRNRYWATPLPFWRCQNGNPKSEIRNPKHCNNVVCIGSLEELQKRAVNYDEVYKSRDLKAIDLHRPYIDGIKLKCEKCGSQMERIPEVVDCWVESGSMPYAEFHYPFSAKGGSAAGGENSESFEKRYPADFVAEYIAQTRAWFYVMHVLGVTLFGKAPFKNVVTTGTILNEKGEKLSKSKRNYPEPQAIIDKYGVDALRFYLMTSPVMQAENLFFAEREVGEAYKKIVLITLNVVSFYKLYSSLRDGAPSLSDDQTTSSRHVLDRWIVARLHETIRDVTAHLDVYNTVRAGRLIPEFINDLSTWYLRRSRDRLKSGKKRDRDQALSTTYYVLATLSKIMAPFMPFLAEHVFLSLRHSERSEESRDYRNGRDPSALPQDDSGVGSVHLTDWPKFKKAKIDVALLGEMATARKVVELTHAARAEAKIKVRQPLLGVRCQGLGVSLSAELLELIAQEVNVKEVTTNGRHPERSAAESKDPACSGTGSLTAFGMTASGWLTKSDGALSVSLNTEITPELRKEGLARELVRLINDARKRAGLTPADTIKLFIAAQNQAVEQVVNENQSAFKKSVIAKSVHWSKSKQDDIMWAGEITIPDYGIIWIGLSKIV